MGLQQFFMSLPHNPDKNITQGEFDISPLTEAIHAFTVSKDSDIPIPSIYWFRPYLSSEFEPISTSTGIDKLYFFLYSTDHESSSEGELRIGKGDNLDLSDFEDIGSVRKREQSETPILIRCPNITDGEEFHLYFHTNQSDPGNNNKQQTRLFTTNNKSLININNNWTDRGRPLPIGITDGENHTGYFRPYRLSKNEWIGSHVISDIVLSGGNPRVAISTSSDGRNWTRLKESPYPEYWLEQDYRLSITKTTLMKLNGEYFGVSILVPVAGATRDISKRMVLSQFDRNTEFIKNLGFVIPDIITDVETYQDTKTTFYIYWTVNKTEVWVQRYKLLNGVMSPRIVDKN